MARGEAGALITICLTTPRLELRRFTSADLPAFAAYRNDPEVARYQSWENETAEEAAAFIEEQSTLEPGLPGRWFQFAVALSPEGRLIGDCGLQIDAPDPRLGEIGFTFGREHQGRGYAFEAVATLLRFAFEDLSLHRVRAVVDCANGRAVVLLGRLGLRREGHFLQRSWFKGGWSDEYEFAILAEEWRDRSRRGAP